VARFKVLAAKYKFWWFTALMLSTGTLIMLSRITFPYALALVVFLTAIFSDMYTTHLCLRMSGKEGNPMVAFLMKKASIWGSFLLSACIWALYIHFMWMNSRANVQTALALTYWIVPINNLFVLRRLKKQRRVQAVNLMNA
jgi:hypothetical protein